MPRPKRQTLFGLPGTSLADVKTTLQHDINALLTAANMFVTGEPNAPPIAASAHQLLERLEAVTDWRGIGAYRLELPRGWTPKAATVVQNLIANIANDDYHLRRCRECRQWMLVKPRHRLKCNRPSCDTAIDTKTARQNRAVVDRHRPPKAGRR